MTAFSFNEEFSVTKCLKAFKIIFLSPELIALPHIAVGLQETYNFSILFYSRLKTHLIAFPLNGLVFIEVVWTQTAISAFCAMLINYVYFPYLFKSNTVQRVSAIINSQRQLNLEKSEFTTDTHHRP